MKVCSILLLAHMFVAAEVPFFKNRDLNLYMETNEARILFAGLSVSPTVSLSARPGQSSSVKTKMDAYLAKVAELRKTNVLVVGADIDEFDELLDDVLRIEEITQQVLQEFSDFEGFADPGSDKEIADPSCHLEWKVADVPKFIDDQLASLSKTVPRFASLDTAYKPEVDGTTVKPTNTGKMIGQIMALSSETKNLLRVWEAMVDDLRREVDMFNALTNGKVPDDILGQLDTLECTPEAQLERTSIEACLKDSQGLTCQLSVVTQNGSMLVKQIRPVPFLVEDHFLQLEFEEEKPVLDSSMAAIADVSSCEDRGEVFVCKNRPTSSPSDCIEGVRLLDLRKITDHCRFRELSLSDTPVIWRLSSGKTFISQASQEPVAVSIGKRTLGEKVALVDHFNEVVVGYGTKQERVAGHESKVADRVSTLAYTDEDLQEILESFSLTHRLKEDWLPSTWMEILTLISVAAQLTLCVPCMVWAARRFLEKKKTGDIKKTVSFGLAHTHPAPSEDVEMQAAPSVAPSSRVAIPHHAGEDPEVHRLMHVSPLDGIEPARDYYRRRERRQDSWRDDTRYPRPGVSPSVAKFRMLLQQE